tara:strand:- start:148 stop:1275 length:1128 start_codon:yes stop_codon:yes gene_type:complete
MGDRAGLKRTAEGGPDIKRAKKALDFVELGGSVTGGVGGGVTSLPGVIELDMEKALEYHGDHEGGVSLFLKARDRLDDGALVDLEVEFKETISESKRGTVSLVDIGKRPFVVKTRVYDTRGEFNDAVERFDKLKGVSRELGLVKFYFESYGDTRTGGDKPKFLTVIVMERLDGDVFDAVQEFRRHGKALSKRFKTRLVNFLGTVIRCLDENKMSFVDLKAENIGVVFTRDGPIFRLIDIDAIDADEMTERTLALPLQDFLRMYKAYEVEPDPEILREFMMINTKFAAMAVAGLLVDDYVSLYTHELMFVDVNGRRISGLERMKSLETFLGTNPITKRIWEAYGNEVNEYFMSMLRAGSEFYNYSCVHSYESKALP